MKTNRNTRIIQRIALCSLMLQAAFYADAQTAPKQTLKTTAGVHLVAMSEYDYTASKFTFGDSFTYSYSGSRGIAPGGNNDYDTAVRFSGTVPDYVSRTIQTFNTANKVTAVITQQWGGSLGWYNKLRDLYTYDSRGNLAMVENQSWPVDSGKWVTSFRTENTFNSKDELVSALSLYRYAGASDTFNKYFYTYNAKSRRTSTVILKPAGAGAWTDVDDTLYTYDASDTLLTEWIHKGAMIIGTKDTFLAVKRGLLSYDASGRLLQYRLQTIDGSDLVTWNDLSTDAMGYDGDGNKIREWGIQGAADTISRTTHTFAHNLILSTLFEFRTSSAFTPMGAVYYYYDGDITGIPGLRNNAGTLELFPVPADDLLHIKLTGTITAPGEGQIADMQGRVWKQWPIPAGDGYQAELRLAELPAGMYCVRISGGDAAPVVKTFSLRH